MQDFMAISTIPTMLISIVLLQLLGAGLCLTVSSHRSVDELVPLHVLPEQFVPDDNTNASTTRPLPLLNSAYTWPDSLPFVDKAEPVYDLDEDYGLRTTGPFKLRFNRLGPTGDFERDKVAVEAMWDFADALLDHSWSAHATYKWPRPPWIIPAAGPWVEMRLRLVEPPPLDYQKMCKELAPLFSNYEKTGLLKWRSPRDMEVDIWYLDHGKWEAAAKFELQFLRPPAPAPNRVPTMPFRAPLVGGRPQLDYLEFTEALDFNPRRYPRYRRWTMLHLITEILKDRLHQDPEAPLSLHEHHIRYRDGPVSGELIFDATAHDFTYGLLRKMYNTMFVVIHDYGMFDSRINIYEGGVIKGHAKWD